MILGISGNSGAGKDTVADYLCANQGFVRVALADVLKRVLQAVFDFSDDQLWGGKRDAPDSRYLHHRQGYLGSQHYGENFRELYKDVPKIMKHAHLADEWGNIPSPPEDVYLSPRVALQTLGTDWGRACYEDVWVDYVMRVCRFLQSGRCGYSRAKGVFDISDLVDAGLVVPKTDVVISDVRFRNEVDAIKAGGCVFRIVRPSADGVVGLEGHASEEEQKTLPDDVFDGVIDNSHSLAVLHELVGKVWLPFARERCAKMSNQEVDHAK